jgi:hypothetical protein
MLVCCGNILISSGQVSNSIVVPNEYESKLGVGIGSSFEGFHQLTYLNSQFSAFGDQDIMINSIALRPKLNAPGSSLDIVVPSIRISMGTFTKPISQLSTIADNNRGADFVLVYNHKNVPMQIVPAGDPNNFSLVFNLDTPFIYNPKNGHFIFEWRASYFALGSAARVDFASYPPLEGPVFGAAELSDALSYGGFIMKINYTTVPEPSPSILMLMLGAVGMIILNSKKGRKVIGKQD